MARRVVGGLQPLGTNRSRRLARAEPEACRPMAVKPLRCASKRGWPRAQMKRTAAMVSEAVWRSASWSGCGVNGEGGVPWPEG